MVDRGDMDHQLASDRKVTVRSLCISELEIDFRFFAGDDVCERLSRPCRHGPSQRAMARVEVQVRVARFAVGRPPAFTEARRRK